VRAPIQLEKRVYAYSEKKGLPRQKSQGGNCELLANPAQEHPSEAKYRQMNQHRRRVIMEQPSRIETMRKIAGWLSAGVERGTRRDKEILRLCNNYRVWARDGEREVLVASMAKEKRL